MILLAFCNSHWFLGPGTSFRWERWSWTASSWLASLAAVIFRIAHGFSKGLTSRLFAGHSIMSRLSLRTNSFTGFAVWQGARSCWKIPSLSGPSFCIVGRIYRCKISIYLAPFIAEPFSCRGHDEWSQVYHDFATENAPNKAKARAGQRRNFPARPCALPHGKAGEGICTHFIFHAM